MLEFTPEVVDEETMDMCMEMMGGGMFEVGPGQVTDDSEMAMCMMWGLIKGNEGNEGETILNLDSIAGYYSQWYQSNPFDIGITTSKALSQLPNVPLACVAAE